MNTFLPEWRYHEGHGGQGDAGSLSTTVVPLGGVHRSEKGFEHLVSLEGGQHLGMLFRVRPKRELRELELRWYIPYGSMRDWR